MLSGKNRPLFEELGNNPALKESIERIVQQAAGHENNFYLLLFGEFLGSFTTSRDPHEIDGYGYKQYIRGHSFHAGTGGSSAIRRSTEKRLF